MLGLLTAAFTGIKIGAADSESLAKNGAAYDTLQLLEDGGVPTGALTPIEVLTETDKAAVRRRHPRRGRRRRPRLRADRPGADSDGRTVVVLVPDEETVNSQSVDVVRRVTDVADDTDGVIGVAGLGADQVDFLHAVYGNLPLMLGLICLLTYILLVRAFRSLLLPLKAVLLNLVSLTAVFGAMVLFWQEGYGSNAVFGIAETGAVTFWIPIMVFAFLYGLSMDYEVFILSRVREEYDAGASTDEAVIRGIGRTGRLVTSAALILFLAFAALASGPGTDIKILATGLGIGILIDATIIRCLLVPALVSLFGSWNWKLPDSVARAAAGRRPRWCTRRSLGSRSPDSGLAQRAMTTPASAGSGRSTEPGRPRRTAPGPQSLPRDSRAVLASSRDDVPAAKPVAAPDRAPAGLRPDPAGEGALVEREA